MGQVSHEPVSHKESRTIDKRGWLDGDFSESTNDYEIYEELAESFGYNSLVSFLDTRLKTCPVEISKTDCRPFYMPCKSELACSISCRVNDYHCGSCSDTNSFRKVCQCCDLQPAAALIKVT